MGLTQITTGGVDDNINIDSNTLKVDGTNNRVGIGTSSPGHKLHLKGTNSSDTGDVTLRVDAGTVSSNSATNNAVLDLTARGKTSGGSALTQNCEIRSIGQTASGGVLSFHTDDTSNALQERLRIDSSGRLLLGTTTEGAAGADNLTVVDSGTCGITIRSGTSSNGNIYFSDATSGTGEFAGYIQYRHGDDALAFGDSSAERMRIDSSGRVGVGTTDVNAPLEVRNSSALQIRTSTGAGNYWEFGRDNSTGDFFLADDGLGTVVAVDQLTGNVGIGTTSPSKPLHIYQTADAGIRIQNSTTGTGTTDGILLESTGSDGLFWNYESGNLRFATGNSERVRIDSSGRLLIGASSNVGSSSVLQVREDSFGRNFEIFRSYDSANTPARIRFSNSRGTSASPTIVVNGDDLGEIRFNGHDGTNYDTPAAAILGVVDGTPGENDMPGRLEFHTTSDGGSSTTERMRIDSSGNVGIGKTSSGNKLEIEGQGNTKAVIDARTDASNGSLASLELWSKNSGGTNNFGQIEYDGDGNFIIGSGGSGGSNVPITFRHGSTEQARIISGGNLLVGTTSHSPGLGNTNVGIDVSGSSGHIAASRSGGQPAYFNRSTSTGTIVSLHYNGTQRGHISTDGTVVAYNTSSDYRLKENIVDLDGAITRVKQLQPRRFNFIEVPSKTVDGFVAHETATVVPEAVTGTHNEVDEDDNPVYQGIDQSKLVPLLTAALQEAIAKIETLEAKVAALEAAE